MSQKEQHEHTEHVPGAIAQDVTATIDSSVIPRSYYTSPRFIGTFFAIGFNLLSSTGGFALIAPVLGTIDRDIGPGNIVWVSLVYTLMLAIGLTLVGQLTDIFGRRWFFILGTALGAIGAIVCSRAHNVNVLIGGQTLIGLSACTGYSYIFVMGELVPMKYRFFANAGIFIFSMPTAGFGSAISTALILHTKQGWRWSYYLLIIFNAVTALLYFVFYHPPRFHQKHGGDKISSWIKSYDYIGMLLYLAGLLLFILGLSWGGTVYPWKSAHVIATIIVGFFCLVALFAYEAYFTPKEPLVRIEFFKSRHWVAATCLLGIGASVYYSQALIFPQMAAAVYGGTKSPTWVGLVGSLPGIGITVGEIIGGGVAHIVGKTKYQVICAMSIGTALIAAMASCTPNTPNQAIALTLLGCTAIGYNEAIAFPITTLCINDQQNIGQAAGLAGSARSAISSVAVAIYSTVLADRQTSVLRSQVAPALAKAGLDASSIAEYMKAAAAGADATKLMVIPGVTEQVLVTAARAYQWAYADAFRTVYYVSIAFGVIGIIFAILTPNVDELLTNKVATRLNQNSRPIATEEAKTMNTPSLA